MDIHQETIDILEASGFEPYNNAPFENTMGYIMVKGRVEEIITSAQQSVRLTSFGVGMLAFFAGFGVCWFVFVR